MKVNFIISLLFYIFNILHTRARIFVAELLFTTGWLYGIIVTGTKSEMEGEGGSRDHISLFFWIWLANFWGEANYALHSTWRI